MKIVKKIALIAALFSVAGYASALTPIADSELSKVSGQDGVSIAADLHINIGEFKYSNTSAGGGSVSFRDIGINGTIGATLDVISNASFLADASALNPASVLGITGGTGLAAFQPGGDVVKIAIPKVDVAANHALNMTVGSITMGGSAASFGAMAMNDIKLQGTTVYIWAH